MDSPSEGKPFAHASSQPQNSTSPQRAGTDGAFDTSSAKQVRKQPFRTTPAKTPHSSVNPSLTYNPSADRAVVLWLFLCCGLILAMAVIGAITRLTESGLSIMEWAPLSGALPPLSQEEWKRLFTLYQTIPEYQQINRGMELAEFKSIFWWEYIHRLWGRLIGLAFALPLAYFWLRNRLPDGSKPHLLALLFLGGMQGAVGWYMVASGFADRTDVSHYRLTLHLMIAVGIYCYIFWLALTLKQEQFQSKRNTATTNTLPSGSITIRLTGLLVISTLLTITSGGFVAGLNAGLIYNSFPLMEGQIIPPSYHSHLPWYLNSFENHAAVQFHHRLLALFTAALALLSAGLCLLGKQTTTGKAKWAAATVLLAAIGQVKLGIMTLLLVVPIPLAAAHQAGALVLLTASLYLLFQLRKNQHNRI